MMTALKADSLTGRRPPACATYLRTPDRDVPAGATSGMRFIGMTLPGNGEAQPDTPPSTDPLVKPLIIKLLKNPVLKKNGDAPGDPSKFADSASNIVGESLIASFSIFNFAF